MARISLDPPRTISYRLGEWFLRRRFGEVLDPYRAMGHNMPVAMAIAKLAQGAEKWNRLDPKLRDLADLAAAVNIGCPWCMDFGYWVLRGRGIPPELIEAVPEWRTSGLFSPLERLAMEYAEAMTATPPTVTDELVAALSRHLDAAQLVELTATVCLENLHSRVNSALGIARQGFRDHCEIPA